MSTGKASRGIVIAAFFAIYFIWGTTYLASLIALKGIPPFLISCFRYLVAGILLLGWAKWRGESLPGLRSVRILSVSGILMLVGGSGLIVYAEQYVNSGYAAVLIATEPLWFVVLDKKRWKEYFSNRLILGGLVLGFLGIALFAWLAKSESFLTTDRTWMIIGTLIILNSAVLWVLGTLYGNKKAVTESSNVMNTSIQLLAAGAFSGLIATLRGEWNDFSVAAVPWDAWTGLGYLIILGSVVAYLAFTWLVTVQPPAVVSTHTFVNPMVAIVCGWLIAGETITFYQGIGLTLALAGVVLTQLGKSKFSSE